MRDNEPTWKIKANGFDFVFDKATIDAADIIQVSPGAFNLIIDHRSVTVKLLEEDAGGKKAKFEIDGEIFETAIKDELDQVLDKMGFSTASAKLIKEIKAPMPGLVLEVAVAERQEVKEGEKLLILGAMKMENVITIHAAAKIKRIAVKAGQAVEKGQVLVELE